MTTNIRPLLNCLCCLTLCTAALATSKLAWGQSTTPLTPPAAEPQAGSIVPSQSAQPATKTKTKTKTETETETETKTETKTENKITDAEKNAAPDFVRVLKKDDVPQALQTAVTTYRKSGQSAGAEVVLIGAVHIAEADYYSKLNQLFKSYDALLYEMVTDPEMGIPDPKERGLSPISTIQIGMKEMLELSFQLDEIDYKAKNFVHADMTPQEFFDTMNSRKEGVLQMFFRSIGSGIALQSTGRGSGDVGLLAALVSDDRAKGLRRAFAEQMQMMDGQMAAITGEDGKSTLITERNAKAFEVLKREMDAGKKKLGIFYGAGHLKDMHERLIKEHGMELVETKWLDAWGL